jgi:4-hydroxy-tetrahydrodipicolinate reductase
MSVRVGVVGAGGRMGSEVCRAVAGDAGAALVAAVDPQGAGRTVGEVTGVADDAGGGVVVAGTLDALADAGVEVVVDFTVPDAIRANLPVYADAGIHAVVGTTGLGEDDLADARRRFSRSNALIVPNFAIGAVLMVRFAELAAPWFDTAEIIELHHDRKVDAPSGTATHTAERMAAASTAWAPDPTEKTVLPGARGGEGPAGIRVHSVRMRGMVAHQEVILGAEGQTLSIRHDSYDRTSFMPGVLLAVHRVGGLPGVTVGLDTLLGF